MISSLFFYLISKAMSVKPANLYFKNDDNMFECKICHKTYPYQNNVIRHVHDHSIPENQYSNFTFQGNQILKSTEKLLLWKALHGISMLALDDTLLSDLLSKDCLQSRTTYQKIMNEMCSQIIENNYSKTHNKNVSVLLDGGTVFHTKWLAVGALCRDNYSLSYHVLDIQVFS